MGVAEQELDRHWMRCALAAAQTAQDHGEVPVGAVLIANQLKISEAGNRCIQAHDPSAHAEILALRLAGSIQKNYRLPNTTLYVTLEPCMMCVGAIVHARVKRLVFGAYDSKAGAVATSISLLDAAHNNHKVEWQGGILEVECKEILQRFFQAKRS